MTSGILLDPEDSYRLAWERPSRERLGHPTITHPPFHTDGRFGVEESALGNWRDLARRVVAHDAGAVAAAARLAQDLGVGELLVVMVSASRKPVREELEAGWNPLAGAFDDEALNWLGSSATLELALYEAVEGRRLWAFTDGLTSWNTKPERLADWTLAAMELMPSPGTQGRHDDVTTPRFRPPHRNDIVVRLGRIEVAGDHGAFLFGTRATYLFRRWMSAGFQIDALIRAPRFVMGGSQAADSPYKRELHDAEVDLFPFYPVLEFHFPRSRERSRLWESRVVMPWRFFERRTTRHNRWGVGAGPCTGISVGRCVTEQLASKAGSRARSLNVMAPTRSPWNGCASASISMAGACRSH